MYNLPELFARFQKVQGRTWVRTVVGLSAFIIIVTLVTNFTIVKVTAVLHDGITGKQTVQAQWADNTKTVWSFLDYQIVPRATQSVIVDINGYKTTKHITTTILGFNSEQVDIYKDTNATKYSTGNMGCNFYDSARDKVLSYECRNTTGIYEYRTPLDGLKSWSTSRTTTFSKSHSVMPFGAGVIGIVDNAGDAKPIFTTDGKNITYFLAPDGINAQQMSFAQIIVDRSDTSSGHFLLTTMDGNVYMATLANSAVSYQKYNHPDGYSIGGNATICSLRNVTAYCFQGLSQKAATAEKVDRSLGINMLTIAVFINGKVNFTRYDVDRSLFIDQILTTTKNNVLAIAQGNVYFLDKAGGTLTPKLIASNITSADASDRAFFIQSDNIYQFDDTTQQSYLRFHSDNLQPTSIISLNSRLIFDALSRNNDKRVYTYIVDADVHNRSQVRMIDKLPLALDAHQYAVDADFVKNSIFVDIKTNQGPNGQAIYDANKSGFLGQLDSLGIDKSVSVIF